jgi:hypothetical protein
MRYVLAALILCAAGTPAPALPIASPDAPSAAKTAPIVQVAKRSRQHASRHGHGLGGIHPLVGSGDY